MPEKSFTPDGYMPHDQMQDPESLQASLMELVSAGAEMTNDDVPGKVKSFEVSRIVSHENGDLEIKRKLDGVEETGLGLIFKKENIIRSGNAFIIRTVGVTSSTWTVHPKRP